jgi:6-phosphofructokinase 2
MNMPTPADPPLGRAQIVTLTMNPALDITTSVDAVRATDKLRCHATRYDAGGGGINVARIAHVLGASVSAVFPAGGATGGLVVKLLRDAGVPFRDVPIAASTRESFTVNETSSGQQYRFVLPGPQLTLREQAHCLEQLRTAAESAEFVVASGSLPPGVTADFYQRVAGICRRLGVRLILDTSGGGLRHVSSGVFLLKASVRELRECVGRPLATEDDQFAAAHQLVHSGRAEVVLVSLGSHGALLVTNHARQRFSAIPMPCGSGVGRGWPLSKSIRLGIAAGAAMLTTPGTAACRRVDVEELFLRSAEPCDAT